MAAAARRGAGTVEEAKREAKTAAQARREAETAAVARASRPRKRRASVKFCHFCLCTSLSIIIIIFLPTFFTFVSNFACKQILY